MRKIVVTEFVSLDGIMESPEKWSFSYWNDDIAKFKQEELESSDTLLLGRITYDGFSKAWPDRTDETGFADRMNTYPKYVVSKSLIKTDWNNTHILGDNFTQGIAKLKEEEGRDILVFGSGELVNTLLALGLVDQLQLLVYPVILGQGKRLFRGEVENKLELKESKSFSSGVVLLTYTSRYV